MKTRGQKFFSDWFRTLVWLGVVFVLFYGMIQDAKRQRKLLETQGELLQRLVEAKIEECAKE